MATLQKVSANEAKPVAAAGQPTPADYQRFWGDRILRTGIGGLGVGAGAASLYYLARGLSQALNAPKREVEEDEEETPKITETKAAGLYDNVTEGVGKMLPDSVADFLRPFTPAVSPKSPNTYDPNVIRSSLGTGATFGAMALGGLGGYKLVETLHNMHKRRKREEEVAEAEQEYYKALVGDGPGKKLDSVYDTAKEKAAAEKQAGPLDWLNNTWDTVKRIPATAGGIYVGTGLGLGGLAAKLMYDRAVERSRAKAVHEAAKSRARVAGILPAYVDPDEIEELRRRAKQNEDEMTLAG